MVGRSSPWERQPKEGKAAYAAFVIYRDLPAKSRSLAATARRLETAEGKGRRGRVLPRLERLSRQWQWGLRAAAWDAEVERHHREAEREDRREMADRHARQARALQQKLLQRLQELDPAELAPGDLVRWLDVAVKVERMSREEVAATPASGTVDPVEGRTVTHAILDDPVASKLACQLLERIAIAAERKEAL